MIALLHILGIIWGAPLGLRAVLFLLIPRWGGVWFPYMPRAMRWDSNNWMFHFVAGRLIPAGFDRTGDGDIDDPDDFITGGQTHWFMVWFRDKEQWNNNKLVKHENRHGWQEKLWGVLFGVSYVGHFLINLARYRDVTKAYMQIVWERDARRHAKGTRR